MMILKSCIQLLWNCVTTLAHPFFTECKQAYTNDKINLSCNFTFATLLTTILVALFLWRVFVSLYLEENSDASTFAVTCDVDRHDGTYQFAAGGRGLFGMSRCGTERCSACPITAAMKNLPKITYAVGKENTCCEKSAHKLAEEQNATIVYLVGKEKFADAGEAKVALVAAT